MGLSAQFRVLLMVAAVLLAASFTVFARLRPRSALLLWLLVVAFIPIWVEVRLKIPVSAVSGVGVLLLASLLWRRPRPYGMADLLAAFLFVVASAPLLVGQLGLSSFVGVTTVWMVGFGLGRFAPQAMSPTWIYGAVAVVFAVVGALAVLEFVTGWHGLASWGPSNSVSATWRPIQERGGLARSEGAFGHSIALGSSLAMAVALAVASPFRPIVRIALIAVMLAGVATTLSRAAVVSAVLGLLLSIMFLRGDSVHRVRKGLSALLLVAAAVFAPYFLRVLAESGEAEGSAAYRGSLLTLLPAIRVFGRSSALQISPTGQTYFGSFRSIDSQLVLFGLTYGAMTLALVLTLLMLAVARVLRCRARPATIAVVAQLPCLLTVALITQYHIFFWFIAGLAVAAEISNRPVSTGDAHFSTNTVNSFERHLV